MPCTEMVPTPCTEMELTDIVMGSAEKDQRFSGKNVFEGWMMGLADAGKNLEGFGKNLVDTGKGFVDNVPGIGKGLVDTG
eukprot:2150319-Rhodomonas_salina.2